MSKAALEVTRTTVLRWFLVQMIVVVLVAVIFLLFKGMAFATAVLLGGVISVLPHAIFARWWFAYFTAKAGNRMIAKFYVGEVVKLFLTVILFILVFTFMSVNILACLLGYIIAQVAFWLGPLFGLRISK